MSSTLPPASGASPYDPPPPGASPYDPPPPGAASSPYAPPPGGAAVPPPAGTPTAPYPYTPPPAPGTDGLAIASLVTGLLGLALIAIGLGIAALSRIKRSGRGGRGMAIAGIVLGALGTVGWTILIGGIVLFARSDGFQSAFTDAYIEGFNEATGYEVGVCFDPEATAVSVTEVDCATPHGAEVVGVELMTEDEYPGDAEADAAAVDFCYSAFQEYVGVDFDSSSLDMKYMYPDPTTWAVGDRQVVCWVETLDGTELGASVQGTGQ